MHFMGVVLFISVILIIFSMLQYGALRKNLPYTVILLATGLVAKELFSAFQLPTELFLSSEVTYHILLPVLLFGSALHLNFHQFRLQFKTISFLATFGLMLSIGVLSILVTLLLGWDIKTSLLFGAIISSTDPIAVLSIFQNLGGPKRLALIADGESMFNDATAVVIFRLLTTVVVAGSSFDANTSLQSLGMFGYTFIGSIIAGALYGYFVSSVLAKIENDRVVETTLTLGASLFIFTAVEYFIHLSGVISVVIAGLFIGNLGRSRISPQVSEFVHNVWEYLGFLAISFVFFFATFHLNPSFLITLFPDWLFVVIAALCARAVSVYVSVWITNRAPFFKDEPNVPTSWQHVLNWGGLRGVIPLVLVLSLPDSYHYKELMLNFTLATLLFTLFINGSTISLLIKRLRLHELSHIEVVQKLYGMIFDVELAIERLKSGDSVGVRKQSTQNQILNWQSERTSMFQHISELKSTQYYEAISMQALVIERGVYQKMLDKNEISESVYFELDGQLDLQADAIEYPELKARNISKEGFVDSTYLFKKQLGAMRAFIAKHRVFSKLFNITPNHILLEQYMLVRARLVGSTRVLRFLTILESSDTINAFTHQIKKIQKKYAQFIETAQSDLASIQREIDVSSYEKSVLSKALEHHDSPWIL